MKRWLVQPITTGEAGQLIPIAPGFTRWTYRNARKLATLLNDHRHTDPDAWTLPPHRWLVLDQRLVTARARAEDHRLNTCAVCGHEPHPGPCELRTSSAPGVVTLLALLALLGVLVAVLVS